MNEDELAEALERRVARVAPRADPDALLARVERRASRQRAWLLVAIVAAVVVGGLGGYLIGRTDTSPAARTSVAASDGTPPVTVPDPGVEPADPIVARAQITQSFHEAFDGGVAPATRDAAFQAGNTLRGLRRDVLAFAEEHGYTAAQLAGTRITILDIRFIDETHAAVRFTLTTPGRGDVIVDKVGYAVLEGDRWKVSLRTACDLLSLDGVIGRCPPAP
jgi:hypothetical protein